MSHIWFTHMNESCHTCEWVMSHIWMSHVTHMNVTALPIRMTFIFMCVIWLIHMCDMTYPYVGHNSQILLCNMTHSYVRHDPFIFVTRLNYTWDTTHSYVRHDSFIRVTWLIHTCDMTRFICVTWLKPRGLTALVRNRHKSGLSRHDRDCAYDLERPALGHVLIGPTHVDCGRASQDIIMSWEARPQGTWKSKWDTEGGPLKTWLRLIFHFEKTWHRGQATQDMTQTLFFHFNLEGGPLKVLESRTLVECRIIDFPKSQLYSNLM